VLPTDTPETLAARILAEEHRVYPEAIRRVLDGGWRLEGRRFVRTRE
jgi:phosphoribosylglycinamide formyltransferase-1